MYDVFVISPYTHHNSDVVEARVAKAEKFLADLTIEGTVAYSTILERLGSFPPNLYFATPSHMKAAFAKSNIIDQNMLIYKSDYKEHGALNFMNLPENTKFDFITGNVPWDDEIDKKFLQKCKNEILAPGGTIALITSASWLRGGSRKNMEVRSALMSTGNVKKVWTYPAEVFINPDTQNPIKAVGACVLYTADKKKGDKIELIRYFGDVRLTTTSILSAANGLMLYLGEEGKELWNICTEDKPKIPLIKYVASDKPKVHFNSKLNLNYLGSSLPLGTITGRELLTGVTLDLDGSNGWTPELRSDSNRTLEDNAAKRYMLEFDIGQEHMARNAYYHFGMRVFGLLLAMTSTISHVNRQSLGEMPYDILTEKYNSLEEYEAAYYKSKKLTPEMIKWIKTLGVDYGYSTNLKGDYTVGKISRKADRVKETGEVFTPAKHIDDILEELVEAGMCKNGKRIVEPSCGDGNFVIAIIQKKLDNGMTATEALKTTYGIELMADNVELCHTRVLELVGDTSEHKELVEHNIVHGDGLKNWDFIKWERKQTQKETDYMFLGM